MSITYDGVLSQKQIMRIGPWTCERKLSLSSLYAFDPETPPSFFH